MANLFFNLPTTPGNGSGATVITSALGREKTITVQGTYAGSVNIEVSLDGSTWAQVVTFSGGSAKKKTVSVAARFMRATRSGVPLVAPGLPNVDVGANDNGARFTGLAATSGNGIGAVVDTSVFGTFNSVTVAGTFTGTVNVQISDDGVDYVTCMTFSGPGIKSKEFAAQFMRVQRSGVDRAAPGLPVVAVGAINDVVSAASISAYGPIVYQPGGTATGPGVVATWVEVMTRISAIRAAQGGAVPIELQFDNTQGAIVFDQGTHDMENVTWTVSPSIDATAFLDIMVPEGVQFTNLRTFLRYGDGTVRLTSTATATSPISDFANGVAIESKGWEFQATGGVPLFDLSSLGAGDIAVFIFSEGGTGFGGTNEAIDLSTVGSIMVIDLGHKGSLQANTIASVLGSSIIYRVADDSSFAFGQQTNSLGTLVFQMATRDRMIVTPVPPATPSANPIASPMTGEYRYDASTAEIAQTLAPASAGLFPGQKVIFKEVSGINGVALTPDGADTIDEGLISSIIVPPGGSITLITNGIDNWDVVGASGAGSVMTWGARSVAAVADTRYLPPGYADITASTLAYFRLSMPRAGFLKKFTVRHNNDQGNGGAVVYDVVINGVSSGLNLSLVTGAIGTASNGSAIIPVEAGDIVDITATKAASITAANVEAIFTAEFI